MSQELLTTEEETDFYPEKEEQEGDDYYYIFSSEDENRIKRFANRPDSDEELNPVVDTELSDAELNPVVDTELSDAELNPVVDGDLTGEELNPVVDAELTDEKISNVVTEELSTNQKHSETNKVHLGILKTKNNAGKRRIKKQKTRNLSIVDQTFKEMNSIVHDSKNEILSTKFNFLNNLCNKTFKRMENDINTLNSQIIEHEATISNMKNRAQNITSCSICVSEEKK